MELPTNFLIICLISLSFIPKLVSSEFITKVCRNPIGNYTVNSTYHNNLKLLLPSLTNQASISLFNNDTVGQGVEQTYGLYMCRGDLNVQQCQKCVTTASTKILEGCPVQKEAIIWYDECLLRFANHSIFSLLELQPLGYFEVNFTVSNPEKFGEVFSQTVNNLIMHAAYDTSSMGYATGQANVTILESVYVVAQCTPDIVGSRCERCLRVALSNMGGCCGIGKRSLGMFLPSCWISYDHSPVVGQFGNSTSASRSLENSDNGSNPESDSSSILPPPVSSGSSAAATITSSGFTFMFGIVMAVSMSYIKA